MAKKDKALTRIEATDGSPYEKMSKIELLLDGSEGAKDELFRRSFNKYVKQQNSAVEA